MSLPKIVPKTLGSGAWEKPSNLTGKGYIVFEYEGGGSLPTTTMLLDDFTIS